MRAPYQTMNQISRHDSPPKGWKLNVFAYLVPCALVLALSVSFEPHCAAQQPVAGSAPALTQLDDVRLNETERIILRTVQSSNPETALELAKAASVLVEIDLFNDARFYLGKIDAMGLDQLKMFELNDKMGADFFIFIHTHAPLQPEGNRLGSIGRFSKAPTTRGTSGCGDVKCVR